MADHGFWRIEVGYGLEGILPDAQAGRIGRTMDPAIKAHDYDRAANLSVTAIAQIIAEDAKVTLDDAAPSAPAEASRPPAAAPSADSDSSSGSLTGLIIPVLFLCGFVGLLILRILRYRARSAGSFSNNYNSGSSPGGMYFGGYNDTSSSSNDSSFSSSSDDSSSDSSSGDSFSGGDGGDSGGGGADGGGDSGGGDGGSGGE